MLLAVRTLAASSDHRRLGNPRTRNNSEEQCLNDILHSQDVVREVKDSHCRLNNNY